MITEKFKLPEIIASTNISFKIKNPNLKKFSISMFV